ncbi:MAG: D-alanyl-D-alanine carboxypeptidase [Clostridia bacterium]|nr:D-alanyl-D-alanine carboxypeptidase [Clostridia bacterium]
MKRKLITCILAAIITLISAVPTAAASEQQLADSAQGAVLMERTTGKVLYYKSAHEKLPMASTTKIMTCILAIENGQLDEVIEVDDAAYAIEGSSIYLKKNERISVRDLLYGLMLASGNDAAVALACHVGGSVEGFAEIMNKKAKSIGCMNTNFVTPNGLHDDAHYTTAYDLGLIACYAMGNETFREVVGTTYYKSETGEITRTWKNKNKILWQYEGGNGVKTGYTMRAGKCLVFSAMRDSMEVVGVVLNDPNMFNDAKSMLDYGLDNFSMAKVLSAGEVIARARVFNGRKNVLALELKDNIMIPVSNDEYANLIPRIITADAINAPVTKGEVLGTLEIWEEDKLLVKSDLVAAQDIDAVSFEYFWNRVIKRFVA